MIYNDFNGIKLSALGMGNMRLPVLDGNDSKGNIIEQIRENMFCIIGFC